MLRFNLCSLEHRLDYRTKQKMCLSNTGQHLDENPWNILLDAYGLNGWRRWQMVVPVLLSYSDAIVESQMQSMLTITLA